PPRPPFLCLATPPDRGGPQAGLRRPPGFLLFCPPGGFRAGGGAVVPAIAAHIDAGADLAGAVADFDVGVPSKNQVLSTARRDARPSGRKRAALCDQLIERSLAVDLFGRVEVEIDCPQVACRTHRRTDHGIGILLPPREDLRLVPGRIFEAVGAERLLVDWIAWKDRNAAAYVVERGLEHGGRVLLRLRTHVILPPSSRKRSKRYLPCFLLGSNSSTA